MLLLSTELTIGSLTTVFVLEEVSLENPYLLNFFTTSFWKNAPESSCCAEAPSWSLKRLARLGFATL